MIEEEEEDKGTREYYDTRLKAAVFFDFDSYVLGEESKALLLAQSDWLKEYFRGGVVYIEGHCDERGTREYNIALGAKRAYAVVEYLMLLGVPKRWLQTVSYGKERPLISESLETSWAQNRRALITFTTPSE